MAAGIAEAPGPGHLLAEVAVVEDGELVVEHLRDRRHVAVDVGDDADADLVGDLLERVGVEHLVVGGTVGLLRERRHALGAAGDAEVVDAGVVEQHLDQLDVGPGRGAQLRLPRGIGAYCLAHRLLLTHGHSLPVRPERVDVAPQGEPDGVG